MPRLCECGRNIFVIPHRKRAGNQTTSKDHDLCNRCYDSARARAVAKRMGPKPLWAVKSSIMHDIQEYA